MSPKFIAGESYGTLRGAALAEHLQERYGLLPRRADPHLERARPVVDRLRQAAQRPARTRSTCRRMPRSPTTTASTAAAGSGSARRGGGVCRPRLPVGAPPGCPADAAERRDAVATLARLTGLTEDYVDRADLRIEHWRYFTELLRDRGLSVGRLDGRFTGPAASAIAERHGRRPVDGRDRGPVCRDVEPLRARRAGLRQRPPYAQISELVAEWSFKDFEGRPIDVSPPARPGDARQPPPQRAHRLRLLRRRDAALRGEDVVAHLEVPDSLRANVEHAYYEAGHMMYVHEESRVAEAEGIARFVTAQSKPRPSRVERAQPQVAPPLAAGRLAPATSGSLDADRGDRLGRERQRLAAHHLQLGALGSSPRRAGRA